MILCPIVANNKVRAIPIIINTTCPICGLSMIRGTPPTNTIPAKTNFDISKKYPASFSLILKSRSSRSFLDTRYCSILFHNWF